MCFPFAEAGTENSDIGLTFRNFDSWSGGKDIAAYNEVWNIAAYASGTPDTTTVEIDGWTTATSTYIRVYTPTAANEVGISQRHNGKWETSGAYTLSYTTAAQYGMTLENKEDYVRIDGLQIEINYSHDDARAINMVPLSTGANEVQISHNIIRGDSTGDSITGIGIRFGSTAGNIVEVWNNVVYGFIDDNSSSGTGIVVNGTTNSNDQKFYNNTVYGCYAGIEDGTYKGGIVVNNISYNNSNADFTGTFDDSPACDYNLSEDDTAPGGNSIHAITDGKIPVFVSTSTGDFHLAASDAAARDKGVNLSADAYLAFNTDIEGEPRRDGLWDIGADESDLRTKVKIKNGTMRIKGGIMKINKIEENFIKYAILGRQRWA